ILEHPGLLAIALKTHDLLIQAGQLCGVRVDFADRLAHRLVNSLLDAAQLLPSLLECRGQVLSRRNYRLSRGGIRRIISKLLETIKEVVESVTEPGALRFIEKGLDLIHGAHISLELVLLLGF